MTRLERGASYATQEPTKAHKNLASRVPHETVARYRQLHDENHAIITQIKSDHADVFPHHHATHAPTDLKFRHLPSRTEAAK